jgi:Leucine-rich repeat (LRR) protein
MKNLKKLDLSRNNIQGQIPTKLGSPIADETIRLQKLDLSHNQIGGVLPYSIASSTSLIDVDLSHNRINGMVPSFSILSRISYLDLGHNAFMGPLPLFGPEMTYIGLENNSFAGFIHALESASSLESLSLDHNQLIGEFELMENQNRQLKFLQISYNKFTSFSTKGIALWSSKLWCDAAHNNFACPLPAVITSLCHVTCI